MEGLYTVGYQGKVMGQVLLQRNSLYYSVDCRCTIPDAQVYVLKLETKGQCLDLGILYPMEYNQFGMKTKIPAKKIEQGSLEFWIQSRDENMNAYSLGKPLPTAVIVNIDQLRLCRLDGEACLILNCEKNS